MFLKDKTVTDKSTMMHICIFYRMISLLVSTIAYLFFSDHGVTLLRIGVASGMAAAGGIGIFLHICNFNETEGSGTVWQTIPTYIENIAYGLFLMLSGGLSSPYLWYFISVFTMMMANERFLKRWQFGTLLSLLWCLLCALLGGWYGSGNAMQHPYINSVIGFLMVIGGFYILFIYIVALDQSQMELERSNELLRQQTQRSEQALQHTLDIYNTLQLFGITEPGKVMEEITGLLRRTVAHQGCLLVKTGPMRQVERAYNSGLPSAHEDYLLEHFEELAVSSDTETEYAIIDVMESMYRLIPISGPYGVTGIMVAPTGENDTGNFEVEVHQRFYLYLAGVLLQNLDMQEMVEDSIVSEEQARIVNEIHDTVIQKLFVVACNLRLLETQSEQCSPEELTTQLRQIKQVVESTMTELREAICGVRWEADGKASLVHKLTAFLKEIELLSGTNICLQFKDDGEFMSISQKTAIYRIVCEAVSNAVRHGKAKDVQVAAGISGENWNIEIADNGTGFAQGHVSQQGHGLKNMYRMANRLKGHLTVDSKMGTGTCVKCRFPR